MVIISPKRRPTIKHIKLWAKLCLKELVVLSRFLQSKKCCPNTRSTMQSVHTSLDQALSQTGAMALAGTRQMMQLFRHVTLRPSLNLKAIFSIALRRVILEQQFSRLMHMLTRLTLPKFSMAPGISMRSQVRTPTTPSKSCLARSRDKASMTATMASSIGICGWQ